MNTVERFKYGRTYHVPFSPGATSDDKMLSNLDHFVGQEVVITEKRDGECTTIYGDGYSHARSIDGRSHPSRDWLKANIVPLIAHHVTPTLRVCGENLYAKHSIYYEDLITYFEVFSIWEERTCLGWDETMEICSILGLTPVPVLYRGTFNEKSLHQIINNLDLTKQEGCVIRLVSNFQIEEFSTSIAKYVRKGHVTSEDHWMYQTIVPNKLRSQI